MDNATGSHYHVVAEFCPFQYNGVCTDETVIAYLDWLPSCIFLVKPLMSVLQFHGVEVIVDNLAVGSYAGVAAYLDAVPSIDGAAADTAMLSNLNLSAVPSHYDGALV